MYLKEMQAHLLCDFEAMSELKSAFKKLHESVAKQLSRVLGSSVCRVASRRLLNKALQMCKEHAGSLLGSIRSIRPIQIAQREHFDKGSHSEPYFYDSSYQPVRRVSPMGQENVYVLANDSEKDGSDTKGLKFKWECSSECKPVTDAEVDAIVSLKVAFEGPIEKVRHALDTCNEGCPNDTNCIFPC